MRLFVRLLLPVCYVCFLAACHRPTAYFQRTTHAPAARLPIDQPTLTAETAQPEIDSAVSTVVATPAPVLHESTVASLTNRPTTSRPSDARVERRMHRIQSILASSTETVDKQPTPKPKKKLRLGNQIREKLGVPLRKELNWWQRISWKLKASVIVVAVAVLFAIINVTILAIIFGILGAFLLITGLKRSMKVRRPWF